MCVCGCGCGCGCVCDVGCICWCIVHELACAYRCRLVFVAVVVFNLHCPSLNAIFLCFCTARRALVYTRGSRFIVFIIIIS